MVWKKGQNYPYLIIGSVIITVSCLIFYNIKDLYSKHQQLDTNMKNLANKLQSLSIQNNQNLIISQQLLNEINSNNNDPNVRIDATSESDDSTLKNIIDNLSDSSSSSDRQDQIESTQLNHPASNIDTDTKIDEKSCDAMSDEVLDVNDLEVAEKHESPLQIKNDSKPDRFLENDLDLLKNEKLDKLKEKCRVLNLSSKGTKDQLASRIFEHCQNKNT